MLELTQEQTKRLANSSHGPELIRLAERAKNRNRWKRDPLAYFTERLGIRPETIDWSLIPEYKDHEWDGTPNPLKAILDALVRNEWVGVESAVGTGKTFLASLVSLWFFECFDNALVVTTAPKEKQLELHVWKELGKIQPKIGLGISKYLKIQMLDGKDEWVIVGFIAGVKAEEVGASATKAQGFHAENMLIICEETPGISDAVMSAFQNTSISPHNLILALGNPDHRFDTLHRFCELDNVTAIRISAFDHPNVVLDNPNFIIGATSRAGIARIEKKYHGSHHPLAMSRTKGISPAQATDALIRADWIRSAQRRMPTTGVPSLGVDVANSPDGDKGAIARGEGSTCIEVIDFPCPDANQLGTRVFHIMRQRNISPEHVGVDGVGVGAGTVNELLRLGARVENLQGGEKPKSVSDDGVELVEKYKNLRSQMWWQLRLDLSDPASDLVMPDDEDLVADLVTIKYEEKDKIVVESKETLKKRLGRSPNKGDAFVYWNWVRERRDTVGAFADPDEAVLTQEEKATFRQQEAEERREIDEVYNVRRKRIF
jgi:hypothetical protein